MPNHTETFDWSLLQSFLAVAETGSLSGAARKLSLSQPTVGRHVQALEAQVGAALFARQARGMALSDAGARLVEPARRMAEAAGQLSLTAMGEGDGASGTVRVTASVVTAHNHLPKIFAGLRAEHPEIEIEVVASNASENLLFREADIAVRMYRPEQLDMVTKHLGDFALGLYAARSYLDRRGWPKTFDDLEGHDLIGYDRSETLIRGMRAFGWAVTREDFPVRCDHHAVYWKLLRAGAGIGFAQVSIARDAPDVVQLLPDIPLPGLPVWLTAHQAVRRTPRVAVVWDALVQGLTPSLAPPGHLPEMPN
ncbi:MAG: LysR family transcriptional regulator [Pseudomonadota bacterium]